MVCLGDKIGEIEVIEILGYYTEPNGHRRRMVKVRCSCGKTWSSPWETLKRNKSGFCKKCCLEQVRRKVHPGDVFDQLTVICYIHYNKRPMVKCRCSCGNIFEIRSELLFKNKTNHCGCKPIGSYSGVGDLSQTFFGKIRKNAEVRGMSFNISINDAWELYLSQNKKCALTGIDITMNYNYRGTASLDRINSKFPYVKDNIQWVHKDINRMKMDFNQERFIELCKLVANHNK